MEDHSKHTHLTNKELKAKLTKQEADFCSKLKDKDDVISAFKNSIELYQKVNKECDEKLLASKSMLQDMQKQLSDLQAEHNSSSAIFQKNTELIKEYAGTIEQLRKNITASENALENQSRTMAEQQSRLEDNENCLKQSHIQLSAHKMEIQEHLKTKKRMSREIKDLRTALFYFVLLSFVGAIGLSYIRLVLILFLQLCIVIVMDKSGMFARITRLENNEKCL